MSFAHGISGRNNNTFAVIDKTAEIGLYLCHAHRTIFMNGINLSVIIKQHG